VRHPYTALETRQLGVATVALGTAWALLTILLLQAVPLVDFPKIGRILGASTAADLSAVLADWTPATLRSFAFLLGFDLLYDLVHNNAAAVYALWASRICARPWAERLAAAAAWLLWLATVLNVFENLAFLHMLPDGDSSWLLPWASLAFNLRSLFLAGALGIGCLFQVLAHFPAAQAADADD